MKGGPETPQSSGSPPQGHTGCPACGGPSGYPSGPSAWRSPFTFHSTQNSFWSPRATLTSIPAHIPHFHRQVAAPVPRQVSPTCHTPIPALPLLLCRCPGGLTSALGWAGRTCSGRVGTHPPGGAQRVPPSLTGAKEPAERNTTSAASTAWPKKAGRQRMILHPAPTPATSLPHHGSCCPGFRDLTRHTHPLMPDD